MTAQFTEIKNFKITDISTQDYRTDFLVAFSFNYKGKAGLAIIYNLIDDESLCEGPRPNTGIMALESLAFEDIDNIVKGQSKVEIKASLYTVGFSCGDGEPHTYFEHVEDKELTVDACTAAIKLLQEGGYDFT